jgi:uncharacterized membrane protein
MRKADFLAQLRRKLSTLPHSEVEATIEYYSEMIDDYIESGYSQQAAVAQLGRVENVAAQVLAGAHGPTYEAYGVQKTGRSGFATAMLIISSPLWGSLLVAAFAILLALAIVIAVVGIVVPWSLIVSFGASALALLAATPVVFINEGIVSAMIVLGAAFVLAALCILCLCAGIGLTKLSVRIIAVMFRRFFNLIFRRR